MIKYLKELPEIVKTSLVIASLLGIGGGGMAWHHHKYHGHDHDRSAVEQSQKYKMSDDETRLKIHEDYLKEKESR
jgi:hypothetical protein